MIVYRDHKRLYKTADYMSDLRSLLARLSRSPPINHDLTVELLIDMGELESALAESLCQDHDFRSPAMSLFRKASTVAAHVFCASWERRSDAAMVWVARLAGMLDEISAFPIPPLVRVSVPDGYAYDGVFPETYYAAARKFIRCVIDTPIFCIGIRSIGTSLSAVAAALLEESGRRVESCTVRPRGLLSDPFLRLSPDLEDYLRARSSSHFLIIDEGPGLSGSSFCCVAQTLSELGIGDRNISFLAGRETDGKGFVGEAARSRWPRHRTFSAQFDEVWLASGRLCHSFPHGGLVDISAGNWRKIFYGAEADYPAVYPSLERRKYLCLPERHGFCGIPTLPDLEHVQKNGTEVFIVKFAGLGRYGRAAYERACLIAEAGFSPPVLGLSNGFIIFKCIAARPLTAGDANDTFLTTLARYCAFLQQRFPSEQTRTFYEMIEMICGNIDEILGKTWVDRFKRSIAAHSIKYGSRSTAIDGRMQPHEWLGAGDTYFKADATDHHADHFFPGCHDIAWDIAGSQIEFGLEAERLNFFLERYESLAHDPQLPRRLPIYRIAYLSYQVGFTKLASQALSSTPDGEKFKLLFERYCAALKAAIQRD